MSRKLLGACAAVCLIATSAVGSGQMNGASSEPADRLTQERMAELVAGPMAIVERRGLAAGKASFDRVLAAMRARHGANSVEVADLLIAFGVGLYNLGMERDDRPIKEAAIPYLEAAIPAYRAAFGDAHPEVSVALNSYADAQSELHRDNPPASVDAAREESYRITSAASGPASPQTLATLRNLIGIKGHPSRTQGDPGRVEAVAALYRQLIASLSDDSQLPETSTSFGHAGLARIYAENRMAAEAREQLRLAIARAQGWPALERCFFVSTEVAEVQAMLDGTPRPDGDAMLRCLRVPD